MVLTIQIVRQSEEVAAQVSLQGDTAVTAQEVRSKNKTLIGNYVVHVHKVNNLFSHTLSVEMNLVSRVDDNLTNAHKELQPFSTSKTQPVKIKLGEDAVPYTVHIARLVSFPMLQKVKTNC